MSTELNKAFFQKVIRSYENDESAEILDLKVNGGSLDGGHFASSMRRATISYSSNPVKSEEKSTSVYIKCMPSEEKALKLMENIPMFETEIKMYSETICAMDRLLESLGEKFRFAPELIFKSDATQIIVIKDAGKEGFVCHTTPIGDPAEMKQIYKRLAKFHAVSYYLAETEHKDFTNYNATIYESPQTLETFFYQSFRAFRSVLETWEGFEHVLPKLDYLIENLADVGRKLYAPNKSGHGYNVLNHGDFHLRNMVLKFDENHKIQDMRFIDFQISVWASPAIDLCFATSCATREVLDTHGDEFISYYHQEFVETLRSLGYLKEPPTLVDLHVELMRHGSLAAIVDLAFASLMFMDPSKMSPEDMITGINSFEFKKKVLQTEGCVKYMKKKVKEFVNKGWL